VGASTDVGEDQWCGCWKLYWPDGTPLPHDACPMAVALKTRQPVRNVEAIAEKPDGTRVPFAPYPTPLFDTSGELVGAVNMLVDLTHRKQAEEYAQRLASVVESSDDAIVSKDLRGVVQCWNKGAERGGPGFLHRALSGFLPDSGHDLCPRIRRDHEEESTPEPLAGLQS